jgi:hypothetical protein
LVAPQPIAAIPTQKATVEPVPGVDQAKLEALSKPLDTAPKKVEPEKPADLEKANEKLSSLLGKPK